MQSKPSPSQCVPDSSGRYSGGELLCWQPKWEWWGQGKVNTEVTNTISLGRHSITTPQTLYFNRWGDTYWHFVVQQPTTLGITKASRIDKIASLCCVVKGGGWANWNCLRTRKVSTKTTTGYQCHLDVWKGFTVLWESPLYGLLRTICGMGSWSLSRFALVGVITLCRCTVPHIEW